MAPRRSTRIRTATAAASKIEPESKPSAKPKAKAKPKAAIKKRAAPTRKKAPLTKKRKTGLKSVVDTSTVLGVVDPASKINGTIEILDNEPCDCMLVLLDPTKNIDKFYILQLIVGANDENFVYSRWGRTGSSGQGLEEKFEEYADAVKTFEKKFKEKSGLKWENRSDPTASGKYRVIQQNFVEKLGGYNSAKWQYWVDDGIDGKKTGWYDYDDSGSKNVEQLFQENLNNSRLTNRLVDSGAYTYNVDLDQMTQTNVKHPNKTSRHIRRYANGADLDNESPPITKVSSLNIPPSLTVSTGTSNVNIVTPTTSPTSSASSPSTAKPPVDTDVPNSQMFSVVKNTVNDKWYDVVLNQCNITGSSNNNKYYRLQILNSSSTGQFYVWLKWGRVGESSTGQDLKGPFATEIAAFKLFAKKYRDKTKNTWGDDFVAHKGKYTLIEIDHEVEVKPEFKAPDADEDVEYLKSELDPKTKELIEVIFSKEMRDEALTSFNLDLKKLPLGVPSQQQIQNGVSILNQIEDKLSGENVSDSYAELSSRFYTEIPHSFGRKRPPAISTQSSLQDRYDMCNILLDMFSTNETLRQVAAKKTKKQVPYPADSHYETLKSDLTWIEEKSNEFKIINKYFNETKGHSSAKILDVWSVNREGEEERHKAFEDIDNRRLLWHGTNIAVVAPIISSGLRIMPHSGGRVGAGIYLASMQAKSAQYTSGYGSKFACMFLCEGALGKSHTVTSDGHHASSLKKAPAGFESVHAVGSITPQSWTTMTIGGKPVQVPDTKAHNSGVSSSFHHDEFLVYDEAQVRLRYVLTVKLY
jgi:poly [ADP-ribose] polymerase